MPPEARFFRANGEVHGSWRFVNLSLQHAGHSRLSQTCWKAVWWSCPNATTLTLITEQTVKVCHNMLNPIYQFKSDNQLFLCKSIVKQQSDFFFSRLCSGWKWCQWVVCATKIRKDNTPCCCMYSLQSSFFRLWASWHQPQTIKFFVIVSCTANNSNY